MTREQLQHKLQTVSSYSEEAIELSALIMLHDFGWEVITAYDETDGDPTLLGREHHGEVILRRYLMPKLREFNPHLPTEALELAIEQMNISRSVMSPVAANREVYHFLKDKIRVDFTAPRGELKTERGAVIDWDNPERNHFLAVSQLWVNGDLYRRRPDIVLFVNGIPLGLIELKSADVNLHHAYSDNLRDYKDTIPHLLWYNAMVILSNGSEAKMGGFSAPWEHFATWKKVEDEKEQGVISLETMLNAVCRRDRFLDLAENFVLFQEDKGGLIKLVAKNHQYLGVNSVFKAMEKFKENRGRLGVFWHTQGSGKSESMIFFSQKVLRKIPGTWTFLIVTDRTELDDQAYRRFERSGVVSNQHLQAQSINHLRELLKGNHRYIFTLIHKFQTDQGGKHPVLSERDDIIVITDEAHRSQYDLLAQNMRDALPYASFIGFTGTPLIRGEEERTREVFGDYVSIYNYKESTDDKATVPLFYENRIPELQLTAYGEAFMDDEIHRIIEEALLDDEAEIKIERKLGKLYHLITRDDRLEKIAVDVVEHFIGRGFRGKAMYVAIDKATAIKMYDKVQKHWKKKIEELKQKANVASNDDREFYLNEIKYMQETGMAVVVSQSQNEVDDLRRKGVDIAPHRKRINEEELDEKFKKPDDPLSIVFVCAMWMTGFDVPACSTMYLDKPLKNHTLMQTIARANRVFGDKQNGLIVDYVGIFRALEKALSIYATDGQDRIDTPIKDKKELKNFLIKAIDDVKIFLEPMNINLEKIRLEPDVLKKISLVDDATNSLLVNDDTKKEYLRLADGVKQLHKAYLPDPIEAVWGETAYVIRKIAKKLRATGEEAEEKMENVYREIDKVLDRSVKGFEIKEPGVSAKMVDLSKIDVEALVEKFSKTLHKRIEFEKLRDAIQKRLASMITKNEMRVNFREKFEELIREYNQGTASLEEIFKQLVYLSQELDTEEQRYLREGLKSEEELAIFDLLTKPDMKLSESEIRQVKTVARQLYERLTTELLGWNWRQTVQSRAKVKLEIERSLDLLPEMFTSQIYEQKCHRIYEYVYGMVA